jgi:TetR/AcrR family transcriptional repressor of nem operon
MPRASKEQSARNRQAITEAASRIFRERGLAGISVADLMAEIGLTPGGFYSQFSSREDLAAHALAHAFEGGNGELKRQLERAEEPGEVLQEFVDGYLSAASRDDVGGGCAATAWCGELAKEEGEGPVVEAYLDGLKDMIGNVGAMIRAAGETPSREQVLASVAMLVGALALSRATRPDRLSGEILRAARRQLPKVYGDG